MSESLEILMNDPSDDFDVIIIGAGIAGASAAHFLADRGMTNVLILERESQPGYHATGRSAAVLVEFDLVQPLLTLKILGAQFLRNPPTGFSENSILQQSGILMLFQGSLWEQILGMVPELRQSGVTIEVLDQAETVTRMPVVSTENFDGALYLPEDGHIDVNELLWGYLRQARGRGARLRCEEAVTGITVEGGRCVGVVTRSGVYRSRWVVNAAGAWAGKIRDLIGPSPVQMTPHRRTIVAFRAPEDFSIGQWPLVADLSHDLYFSPESGGLMASPMDQDPMPPCDVRPDELGIALTMARLGELAPRLVPRSIANKWAGLRTFAPDQIMVIGEDPMVKGFFWLAGQGGAGIETSPAVGRIAADLITQGRTDLVDAAIYSPARFGCEAQGVRGEA
jgi:D-arginine dehydrogenase